MPSRRVKLLLGAASVGIAALGVLAAFPDTTVGYLARAGWFQAELLLGRVPLDEPAAREGLDAKALARLELVPEIRAYAKTLGLAVSDSYTSINPTWERTIWNVSACEPLRFRSVRWKFPIVGSVPYLGYFRIEDARHRARDLEAQGYDVMVRPAGAYSTLGWFDDPILPPMLHWDEERLADTLLHESVHATVWIPGTVSFNESLASFVGEEASLRFMTDRYGTDSDEVKEVLARREDGRRYRELMHEVYEALEGIYQDRGRTPGEKLRDKHLVLAAIPARIAALHLENGDRYVRAALRYEWNNARLAQFRVYNDRRAGFVAILEEQGGDLPAFLGRVEEITRGAEDPFDAIAVATGTAPSTDERSESSKP